MKTVHNERGMASFSAVFLILFFMLLLSVFSTWIAVGANTVRIRNTVKSELTAVSMKIADDTYTALREGNLSAYERKLTESTEYHETLLQSVKNGISESMDLYNDNYTVENIALTFRKTASAITYCLSCDVVYRIPLLGSTKTVQTETLSFEGRHILKEK